jgi:hypothetical protein
MSFFKTIIDLFSAALLAAAAVAVGSGHWMSIGAVGAAWAILAFYLIQDTIIERKHYWRSAFGIFFAAEAMPCFWFETSLPIPVATVALSVASLMAFVSGLTGNPAYDLDEDPTKE